MEELMNEDNRRFGIDIKIITIGNLSTGKTSILNRYVHKTFDEHSRATINPEFSFEIIKINGAIFRIQFWDLPGQDRNPALTSIFCKDAQGIIFCCEVNNDKSREDLIKWEQSLNNIIDISNIPKILIENKCDLLGENNYEEGLDELKKFANDNNFSGSFRASALNGYNIDTAIKFLINEIVKTLDEDDVRTCKDLESKKINKNELKNNNMRCC